MRDARTFGVVAAIGIASAWLWMRIGLYGFGLPAGLAVLLPLAVLAAIYMRWRRIARLGVLLGAFGATWAAFEAGAWLNAATDPAVSIPGWSPVPLGASVAFLVLAIALGVAGTRS